MFHGFCVKFLSQYLVSGDGTAVNTLGRSTKVPPLPAGEWLAIVMSWKPGGADSIVRMKRVLRARFPGEVGFVDLACHDRGGNAGIYQNWEQMGEAAVDTLVAMLNRGERGVPEFAPHTLTAGVWVDGTMLLT